MRPDAKVDLDWQVGHAASATAEPQRWAPATVPGAVQLDWAKAEGWPPFHVAEEPTRYRWMEDAWWTYRATLTPPALAPDERLVLTCGGIDYQHRILINGHPVHEQEGMFAPVELDLTGHVAGPIELRLLVFPAPKRPGRPDDRTQASRCCKPAVSYGWDFHPRLIPLGIWQALAVTVRQRGWVRRAGVRYTLSPDLDRAELTAEIDVAEPSDTTLRWRLMAPGGETVVDRSAAAATACVVLRAALDGPVLWWPHDQGEPALYTSIVERCDGKGVVLEEHVRRIGFRRARLVMNADAWGEPRGFPKSRSAPPITLEINGRRVFAKGSNWVSPDIFPGTLDGERYQEQLDLARGANMNLLRMWGGAPVQKDAFYERCDQLGIMVWQEFPLACNNYEDDPHYLEVLDRESRAILQRLREHPSVVIWCGGNELFNVWSGMTDQSLALRLLGRNCFELDPFTPFLPTSPVTGMGHGSYLFRDMVEDDEAWAMFQRSRCTAYTEFGVPGPAPVEVIDSFMPAEQRFPPRQDGVWRAHHGYGAWGARITSHLYADVIEHYFGPSSSLEELVERGQLLQSEGYRGLFEEIRRQQPHASMALNWCLNEPWPAVANNSLIAWPCVPKPALAAVGEALRPVLASARIRRFAWREGDPFDPQLWMLNDAPRSIEGGVVTATLVMGEQSFDLLDWRFDDLQPQTNRRGPTLAFELPHVAGVSRMSLHLDVAGRPELSSRYVLLYAARTRKQPRPTTRILNA